MKPELKEIKKNSPSKFSEALKKAANGEWDDFNALLEEAYTTHETETSGGRMYLNEENWEKHCVARGKDDKYAAREWKKHLRGKGGDHPTTTKNGRFYIIVEKELTEDWRKIRGTTRRTQNTLKDKRRALNLRKKVKSKQQADMYVSSSEDEDADMDDADDEDGEESEEEDSDTGEGAGGRGR